MQTRRFLDLSPEHFSGACVVLDIDGTLVGDRSLELSGDVAEKVKQLGAVASVYFCSNALPDRAKDFATQLKVAYLPGKYKKPSRRAAEGLPTFNGPVIVVGDKVITDGLFASNIGAEFVLVSRFRTASESVRARVGYALDAVVRPLFFFLQPILPYIVLIRPTQWVKNFLVFTPLIFAGAALSLPLVGASVVAFLVFSLAASSMYVLNDLKDRDADALHPTKRFRPLASGAVGVPYAYGIMLTLAGGSFALAGLYPGLLVVLLAYVSLNTLYSLYLKRVPVFDVVSVSGSYVLRVLAGGAVTGILVSPWLIACVFFGSLVLITGKRRFEFSRTNRRTVLKRYSKRALDLLLIGASSLAIISYALYAFFAGHGLLVALSAFLVALAIVRLTYLVLTSEDAEYPEVLAFKDSIMVAVSSGWFALMVSVLYFGF